MSNSLARSDSQGPLSRQLPLLVSCRGFLLLLATSGLTPLARSLARSQISPPLRRYTSLQLCRLRLVGKPRKQLWLGELACGTSFRTSVILSSVLIYSHSTGIAAAAYNIYAFFHTRAIIHCTCAACGGVCCPAGPVYIYIYINIFIYIIHIIEIY